MIRSKVLDFGRDWRHRLGESKEATDPDFDDSGWDLVILPHSFNGCDTFAEKRGYYRGPAAYRRSFSTPRRGRRVFIRFDAVWGKLQLWLNGFEIGSFNDGLAGFETELTDHLVGGENVIVARVDNSHDPGVLPGKFIPDYNIYGGICGNVWLLEKPKVYLPWRSLSINAPDVGTDRAIIEVLSGVTGHGKGVDARAKATITDAGKNEVVKTGEVLPGLNELFSFHIEIPYPKLWSPDEPNLYEIKIDLTVDGEQVDSQRERFGLREFKFDENHGLILNGERLQLRGVNRHQDFPGLGNALPRRVNRLDAELIVDMGGNFVRTSHYPQSKQFLDACDELGILVYEEITSWQFIGGDDFIDSANSQMAAMVRRDRNHPSVILWGMMNEGRSKRMFEKLKQTCLEHDPTRPTIYADNKLGDGVFQGTIYVPHVLGVNYNLESIDAFHSAYPGIKLLVSEHTNADNAIPGDRELEKIQSQRISVDLDIIESRSFISGGALWSMHDYGTDYEPVWPVQKSGVLDMYRNPKEAYYMLKSRWTSAPFVHISSDWGRPHDPSEKVEARAYTSCAEVELILNGRSLGSKSGKNPLVWEVEFSPGELKALGKSNGRTLATHKISSPGEPVGIDISSPGRLVADGRDVIILRARIVDGDGVTVEAYEDPIDFVVEGPADLIGIGGSNSARPVAGLANMLVKSRAEGGKITISANGNGLKSTSLELISR